MVTSRSTPYTHHEGIESMTTLTSPRLSAPTHLISTADLAVEQVEELFDRAAWIAAQPTGELLDLLAGRVLGMLFYQNSTRTRLSFEAAMQRLGGTVLGFDDVRTTRAGDFFQESLADTAAVIGQYVDALVLRHTEDGAAARAAAASPVPVINGGDGANEHPTQALLDAWMMRRLLGTLTGACIGLVGDPACRDFRSLIQLLTTLGISEILSLPAPGTDLVEDQLQTLKAAGVGWRPVGSVDDLLVHADVISMLPVQLPTFHLGTTDAPDERPPVEDRYRLTRDKLTHTPRRVPVLHVGPRGQELPPEVDDLDCVHYLAQARAGMHLRAALLEFLICRPS